jgi:hypothetical protein
MYPLPHPFGSAGDDMENIVEEHTTGGPSTMGEKEKDICLLKMSDRDVRVVWHHGRERRREGICRDSDRALFTLMKESIDDVC